MPKCEYTCDCSIIHDSAVKSVMEHRLTDEVYDRAALFFRVLGDPTRFRIIWALSLKELCVCDLANVLGMTKSAVSHQLSTLRGSNLVSWRREGKTVFYSLADRHVMGMLSSALEHVHE